MKRLSLVTAFLVAFGLVAVSTASLAAAAGKSKTNKVPQPSAQTIKWGKAQCDKADKLLAKGEYEKARDIYSQVLWKLPLSPRAKEGLKKCDAAIRAKQNKEREAALKAAKEGKEDAQRRLEIDRKLRAEAAGILSGDPSSIAQKLVQLCVKEDFDTVTATFDDTMKRALTPAALAATWRDIIAQNGKFLNLITTRTTKEEGFDCIYVTCEFEKAKYDAKVVFNEEKKVSGFFILPTQESGAVTSS